MPEEDSAVVADVAPNKDIEPQPDGAGVTTDGLARSELEAELAKWRQRVPRLAAALKTRTNEVVSLKIELEQVQGASAGSSESNAGPASLRARDELIAELEAKVTALQERQRQTEAELHSRNLADDALVADVAGWRSKWQSVTAALDEQTEASARAAAQQAETIAQLQETQQHLSAERAENEARYETLQAETGQAAAANRDLEDQLRSRTADLEAAQERCTSLQARNDKLLETTELANTQIEALGENLGTLQSRLEQREKTLVELGDGHEEQVSLGNRLRGDLERRDQEVGALRDELDERGQQLEALRESLQARGFEQDEAQARASAREAELADRLAATQSELQSLKTLVATQEQSLSQLDRSHQQAVDQARQTEEQLKAELDEAIQSRAQAVAQAAQQSQQSLAQQQAQQAATVAAHDLALANQMLSYEADLAAQQEAAQERLNRVGAQLLDAEEALTRGRSADADSARQAAEDLAALTAQLDARNLALAAEQAERVAERTALGMEAAAQSAMLDAVAGQLAAQSTELASRADAFEAQSEAMEALAATVEAQAASIEAQAAEQAALASQAQSAEHTLAQNLLWLEQLEQQEQAASLKLQALQSTTVSAEQAADQRVEAEERLSGRVEELESALGFAEKDQQAHTLLKSQFKESLSEQARLRMERDQLTRALAESQAAMPAARPAADTFEADAVVSRVEAAAFEEIVRERDAFVVTVMNLEDELQTVRQQLQQQSLQSDQGEPGVPAEEADAALDALAALEALAGLDDQISVSETGAPEGAANEVLRLQALVRERTEEANDLRWQLRMNEASAEGDEPGKPSGGSDDKMLLVLNQQLQRSKEENERLSAQLRALSAGADAPGKAERQDAHAGEPGLQEPSATDDLTLIRGIGDRLVQQLNALGYSRLTQIAALELDDVASAEHPLNGYLSRIERDAWIQQARALCESGAGF